MADPAALLIALTSPAMGSGKSEVAKRLVGAHGFTLIKFAGSLKAMTRALLGELGYSVGIIERQVEGDLKEHPLARFDYSRFLLAIPAMCRALLIEIGYDRDLADRLISGDLQTSVIAELGVSAVVLDDYLTTLADHHFVGDCHPTCRRVMQLLGTEFGRDMIREDIWAHLTQARATSLMLAGRDVVIDDMRYWNEMEKVVGIGGMPLKVFRSVAQVTSSHSSEGALDGVPMDSLLNDGTIPDLHMLVDGIVNRLRGGEGELPAAGIAA